MRSALASVNRRQRSQSILSGVPPAKDSKDYLPELAACAASIVYKSPLPSPDGHPIFIVNSAALPDTFDVDYDTFLPYILDRLPGEDDLLHGTEYEIVLFAGGQLEGATQEKKQGPGIGWYLQAYNVLSRAMRKRLQRLYIVHPRTFVRVLVNVFSTVVSPKFRKKIITVSDLSALERYTPIANLLIPPAAYLHDRKLEEEVDTMVNGLVFGVRHALPRDPDTGYTRLPRILRETSKFVLANASTEGLFRIPPHAVLADVLQEAYDRGQRFIVWKENDTSLAHGVSDALVAEIAPADAYGVHLAAALIKCWYRELHEPIFAESAYSYLRTYQTQDELSLDDLTLLLDPKSATSVLTTTSREILTRHLIPLLADVAKHEESNKMPAANLAICFGMALLRGSDQMEDARMINIVRVIVKSAIQQWPVLSKKLGLTERMFLRDLEAPENSSLYEDPLPEHTPNTSPRAGHTWSHRRSTSVAEDKKEAILHVPRIVQIIPLMTKHREVAKDPPPPVPKRKPAPSISNVAPSTGRDLDTSQQPLHNEAAVTIVPKRKAVGAAQVERPTTSSSASDEIEQDLPAGQYGSLPPTSQSAPLQSDKTIRADLAVDKAEGLLPTSQSPPLQSDEIIFRKPLAPASANRNPSQIAYLARPVLPGSRPPSSSNTITSASLSASFPKPRLPSPGLLQRMNTIERLNNERMNATSPEEDKRPFWEPGKLSLKKASVDDLRRLYEDRLNTVQSLERATMRRSYSQS